MATQEHSCDRRPHWLDLGGMLLQIGFYAVLVLSLIWAARQ